MKYLLFLIPLFFLSCSSSLIDPKYYFDEREHEVLTKNGFGSSSVYWINWEYIKRVYVNAGVIRIEITKTGKKEQHNTYVCHFWYWPTAGQGTSRWGGNHLELRTNRFTLLFEALRWADTEVLRVMADYERGYWICKHGASKPDTIWRKKYN